LIAICAECAKKKCLKGGPALLHLQPGKWAMLQRIGIKDGDVIGTGGDNRKNSILMETIRVLPIPNQFILLPAEFKPSKHLAVFIYIVYLHK